MSESGVVNLFFFVRVLLVGGIAMWFPRITRKGLFFGVYLGEAFFDGDGRRPILRTWDRGVWVLMCLALGTGLVFTAAGRAVAGNLTGTVLLLTGVGVWYVITHRRVSALPRPAMSSSAATATAALLPDAHGAERWTRNALVLVVAVSLATGVFTVLQFEKIPDQVPWLPFPFHGGEGPFQKSWIAVLYPSAGNLILSSMFGFFGLMTATAKRSLRASGTEASLEAQNAFRSRSAKVFSGSAILMCAILATYSIQIVVGLVTNSRPLWIILLVMALVLLVYMAGNLFWLMGKVGQGGAAIEGPNVDGHLSGALADEKPWRWGIFYHNPGDPSLMVESRFGFGYAMNFGNPAARRFTWTYGLLLVALVLVPLLH